MKDPERLLDAPLLGRKRYQTSKLGSFFLQLSIVLITSRTISSFDIASGLSKPSIVSLKSAQGSARFAAFQSSPVKYTSIQHSKQWNEQKSCSKLMMSASSAPMKANLAVNLDQPIFPFDRSSKFKIFQPSSGFWKGFFTILVSDAFKTAVVAFFLALALSVFARSPTSISPQSMNQNLRDNFRLAKGKIVRLMEMVKRKLRGLLFSNRKGTPLVFDNEDGQGGWGVASLMSKKNIGETSYVQYDFQLPLQEHTLPLALGQQLDLCCLSNADEVTKGGFYLYSERDKKGSFSIVAPKVEESRGRALFELGPENNNFAKVLESELEVGDEIAIKPGNNTLSYRGQYLPVTDMIYFTSGMGIVPILHQIKAILPDASSSVKMISIIWVNDDPVDFDIAFKELEDEYFKYNMKLEVSCVVDDLNFSDSSSLNFNPEIEDAIPNFRPGTMAVISGPNAFVEKANEYLVDRRDYPEDSLCFLA